MADQTVKIEPNDVAATAYTMAVDLWYEKHGRRPSADHEDFLKLVSSCAYALQGFYTRYDWKGAI